MHCLASEWFTCDLLNRKQHISINDYDSNLAVKKLGDPEGSVLDILLLVIYSCDFKQSYKNPVNFITLPMSLLYLPSVNQLRNLINKRQEAP